MYTLEPPFDGSVLFAGAAAAAATAVGCHNTDVILALTPVVLMTWTFHPSMAPATAAMIIVSKTMVTRLCLLLLLLRSVPVRIKPLSNPA